jgi:hypothetical protein
MPIGGGGGGGDGGGGAVFWSLGLVGPGMTWRVGFFGFRLQSTKTNLRRTAVVAMVRRSTGATATRRATATAERCRNMVSSSAGGQLGVVVVVSSRRGEVVDWRNGLIWARTEPLEHCTQPAELLAEVVAVSG